MKIEKPDMNIIQNRKARYEYYTEETLECGLVLKGNEVKSIRDGQAHIKGAWATIQDGRLVLRGMHITPWRTANTFDVEEDREIDLLAHRKEIRKLSHVIQQNGATLIPLKVYFNDQGRCKVLLGICYGKKKQDKRESIKKADIERKLQAAVKEKLR